MMLVTPSQSHQYHQKGAVPVAWRSREGSGERQEVFHVVLLPDKIMFYTLVLSHLNSGQDG